MFAYHVVLNNTGFLPMRYVQPTFQVQQNYGMTYLPQHHVMVATPQIRIVPSHIIPNIMDQEISHKGTYADMAQEISVKATMAEINHENKRTRAYCNKCKNDMPSFIRSNGLCPDCMAKIPF